MLVIIFAHSIFGIYEYNDQMAYLHYCDPVVTGIHRQANGLDRAERCYTGKRRGC